MPKSSKEKLQCIAILDDNGKRCQTPATYGLDGHKCYCLNHWENLLKYRAVKIAAKELDNLDKKTLNSQKRPIYQGQFDEYATLRKNTAINGINTCGKKDFEEGRCKVRIECPRIKIESGTDVTKLDLNSSNCKYYNYIPLGPSGRQEPSRGPTKDDEEEPTTKPESRESESENESGSESENESGSESENLLSEEEDEKETESDIESEGEDVKTKGRYTFSNSENEKIKVSRPKNYKSIKISKEAKKMKPKRNVRGRYEYVRNDAAPNIKITKELIESLKNLDITIDLAVAWESVSDIKRDIERRNKAYDKEDALWSVEESVINYIAEMFAPYIFDSNRLEFLLMYLFDYDRRNLNRDFDYFGFTKATGFVEDKNPENLKKFLKETPWQHLKSDAEVKANKKAFNPKPPFLARPYDINIKQRADILQGASAASVILKDLDSKSAKKEDSGGGGGGGGGGGSCEAATNPEDFAKKLNKNDNPCLKDFKIQKDDNGKNINDLINDVFGKNINEYDYLNFYFDKNSLKAKKENTQNKIANFYKILMGVLLKDVKSVKIRNEDYEELKNKLLNILGSDDVRNQIIKDMFQTVTPAATGPAGGSAATGPAGGSAATTPPAAASTAKKTPGAASPAGTASTFADILGLSPDGIKNIYNNIFTKVNTGNNTLGGKIKTAATNISGITKKDDRKNKKDRLLKSLLILERASKLTDDTQKAAIYKLIDDNLNDIINNVNGLDTALDSLTDATIKPMIKLNLPSSLFTDTQINAYITPQP